MTLLSSKLGLNCWLLLLGFTWSKEIPLLLSLPLRYPAPVQMSGEELGINTHRVFSLFKCWVIIDLTPTLMLEKVGRGVEEVEVEGEGELEKAPIPLLSFICSVVNTGFQTFPWGKSPLASNFTSVPLFSLCCSGFLAKSFFKSESVDPLCFFTSTLRALRVDVAPLMDDSSSFSPVLLESFTGLPLFNLWVGSKESVASTSKLSLTTWLFRLWYSTTTLGTSNTK